jgi:hypothetical protein
MYDIMFIIYDIIANIKYDIQVQGRKIYARTANSDAYPHYTGKECISQSSPLGYRSRATRLGCSVCR